jgi:hypothetical protein
MTEEPRAINADVGRNERAPAKGRRLVGLGLLRSLAATVALVALYYLLPLDRMKNVSLALVAGLLILLAVTVWQVRAIIRGQVSGPASCRGPGRHGAVIPAPVRLGLLHHGRNEPGQLQHSFPHPHRRALLHRHHIQHTAGFGDITPSASPPGLW